MGANKSCSTGNNNSQGTKPLLYARNLLPASSLIRRFGAIMVTKRTLPPRGNIHKGVPSMALILSRVDVQRCLDMAEAITAMRVAFGALHHGQAQVQQRVVLDLPEQSAVLLMPSLLQTTEQQTFGLKVITFMPQNPSRGMPRLYASVLLLDAITGRTLAVLEGGWLTAMRTGAVSGLATDLLARRDADVLALFGAGAQAPMQVVAIATVRPLREVRVVNRSDERYAALVEAGDLLQPLATGRIAGPESWTELGSLVTGTQAGRQSEDEVTLFKSVGIAVQDVAVAALVYRKARELGIGVEVEI